MTWGLDRLVHPEPKVLVGIDGCPKGWLAARWTRGEGVQTFVVQDLAEVDEWNPDVVAIDIPIGLPEAGKRDCDVLARQKLGERRSSVFFSPPQSLVRIPHYPEANEASKAQFGCGISKQAYMIYPRIAVAEDWIRSREEPWRVFEVHPELVFQALNSDQPLASKHQFLGLNQRHGILSDLHPGVFEAERDRWKPSVANDHDIMDALACLSAAMEAAKGRAISLPEEPPISPSTGLPMRIVYPASGMEYGFSRTDSPQ